MTETELGKKYKNINTKIPSVWPTFEDAGIELAQEVFMMWNIKNSDLILALSTIDCALAGQGKLGLNLSEHIDSKFAFVGLYPMVQAEYDIKPEV